MKRFCSAFWLVALTCWAHPATAQPIDPHILYEEKCARCHAPHAGDFVFESLDLVNETLVGKTSGRPVFLMLEAGHGRLTPTRTEALMGHFLSIRQSGGLFRRKCRICHENAKDLARLKLIERDGVLWGRYTGRDIALFLQGHGRLDADEVKTMVGVLQRQLETVVRPWN